ncbi:hypothetical protein ACU8V7_09760 [Zobellia nedashkovskayae]
MNSFYDNGSYSDILLEINFKNDLHCFEPKPKPETIETIYAVTEKLNKASHINFKFHSLLLSKIYSKTSILKWVDIEMEFFNVLLATKHANKVTKNGDGIKKVNDQLEYLKVKLVQYLTIQENEFNNTFIKNPLADSFREEIKKKRNSDN